MKTISDKKVNRFVKYLNRQIHQDVFEDRFTVKQIRKEGCSDCHDYHIYLYNFEDKKQPNRNYQKWFREGEIIYSKQLHIEMNNFIITSDFWKTFEKEVYFKDKALCTHCNKYENYTIKKERLTVRLSNNEEISFIGEQIYCKKCKMKIPSYYTTAIRQRNKERIMKIDENFQNELFY